MSSLKTKRRTYTYSCPTCQEVFESSNLFIQHFDLHNQELEANLQNKMISDPFEELSIKQEGVDEYSSYVIQEAQEIIKLIPPVTVIWNGKVQGIKKQPQNQKEYMRSYMKVYRRDNAVKIREEQQKKYLKERSEVLYKRKEQFPEIAYY